MAEVFGVITGAISVGSLAIQVFDSIQQLRQFCASIQDAPETVSNVLEELDILGDTLLHIYQNQKLNQDEIDPSLRRSLTYVDRVAGELQSIMKDLARGMDGSRKKQKWGAIRVALKKNNVRDLLTRLERSKSMLSIAIQCSTIQLQFEQKASNELLHSLLAQPSEILISDRQDVLMEENFHSSIVPQMDVLAKNFDSISDNSVSQLPAYSEQLQLQSMKTTNIQKSYFLWVGLGWYRYQYRSRSKSSRPKGIQNRKTNSSDVDECIERTFIPFAFTGLQGFSLQRTQSCNSWQYTFTPFRVVPVDSPIFSVCASGDVESLIEHLQEEEATLFDTSPDGWTLLHVAAAYARPDMCLWLIQQGIKAEATTDSTAISALHAAALASGQMKPWSYLPGMPCQFGDSTEDRANDVTSVIRVLIEHGSLDPMVPRKQNLQTALHCYTGPSEAFQYMLDYQQHFFVDRGVKNQIGLDIITWSLCQITTHMYTLTRAALGVGALSKDQVTGSFYLAFGPYQQHFFPGSDSRFTLLHWALWRLKCIPFERVMKEGIEFASELIDSGADIHARSIWGHTPFDYTLAWNFINPNNTDIWVWTISDQENYEGDGSYADHGQDMRPIVMAWLQLLRRKGVNLQEYVWTEIMMHKETGIESMEYLRPDIRREITLVECIGIQDIVFNVKDVNIEIDPELRFPGSWPSEPSYVDHQDHDVFLGLKSCADWTIDTRGIAF